MEFLINGVKNGQQTLSSKVNLVCYPMYHLTQKGGDVTNIIKVIYIY